MGLSTQPNPPRQRKSDRPPSTVTDVDGPTPQNDPGSIPEIDPDDIPELREVNGFDDLPHGPIPHQPWRRGETSGCEAPITAPWRIRAEQVISQSAEFVAQKPVVLDVTWFLTSVLVTLDEQVIEEMDRDIWKARGPPIEVLTPRIPQYVDPNNPTPEAIIEEEPSEEEELAKQRELERLKFKRNLRYARKSEGDDPDEPHNLDDWDPDAAESLYSDERLVVEEPEYEELEARPQKTVDAALFVDTAKLSTIAQAILDGLESIEDECQILSRHELVLTAPGAPNFLETQKQFDAYRNHKVVVETVDPWKSNRVLRGLLIDRNSMDVIINKKGMMVTIPHNFVRCVRLAGPKESASPEESTELD